MLRLLCVGKGPTMIVLEPLCMPPCTAHEGTLLGEALAFHPFHRDISSGYVHVLSTP